MNIEIITTALQLDIFGFGTTAANKNYTAAAFACSGKMWEVVKTLQLKNKGKNIWVYETADRIFAGVELEQYTYGITNGLERKQLQLNKYAYYKHSGPYSLIRQAGQNMTQQLSEMGNEVVLPYIEIYGHWTNDESKLETELLMCLR